MIIHQTAEGHGPEVVLLHGLFGMGGNLGALSRSLRDRYRVLSLDLPNHGRSTWIDTMDIPLMAQAIAEHLASHVAGPVVLCGHSLGGKVAMEIALQDDVKSAGLVVVDISPVAYAASHQAVFQGLHAVLTEGCSSRREAMDELAKHIEAPEVVQFLTSSFVRDDVGHWGWRFNLDGLFHSYEQLRAALDGGRSYPGQVLFIKGGESDYMQESHRDVIQAMFPAAGLKVMPAAGHWPHADNPTLFNSIVGRFIDRIQFG